MVTGTRTQRLHREVLHSKPGLCAERAILVTEAHRCRDRDADVVVQRARALDRILRNKTIRIHDDELLVGNFTSYRVGGQIFPELHGVPVLEDVFRFDKRPVNPFVVDSKDRRRLLTDVLPYWLTRFLPLQIRPRLAAARFLADQLSPKRYLINETGGISHFVPDYGTLLAEGTIGYRARIAARRKGANERQTAFLDAAEIVRISLEAFAGRYAKLASNLASSETDPERRAELEAIAAVCTRVPRHPARTLQEGLQSMLFVQIAINMESLDNSVSPGRLDQVLWPHYEASREDGLVPEQMTELLGCFAIKLCEIVPAFSERLTRFHGGMFNGQVVVVGGTDRQGEDATNELTLLWLELMRDLRTRQPNYHARLHAGSPPELRELISEVLASGAASPALYNDEPTVANLVARGISLPDARDYANVGCVEPVPSGKGYMSTDAGLVNLPLCLELALNEGRQLGSRRRMGPRTPHLRRCETIEDVLERLQAHIEYVVSDLIGDLKRIETANANFHPTPLTSVLVDGCVACATDASAGGALYNGSGVQGVGLIEVADSLSALHHVVFEGGHATPVQLLEALRVDFEGHEPLRARLQSAPSFGNDDPAADRFAARVMEIFANTLVGRTNTRGGRYVAGFYSVTTHVGFGSVVGALPSGRKASTPWSSGISPANGCTNNGPTATLLSQARLPLELAPNGVNQNLELAPWTVSGAEGATHLQQLIEGAMAAGCMQLQVNVFDPAVLIEARDNPGTHPGLLVRVSGYSAYFDDLSPEMQQEIIDRNWHA